MQIKCTYSIGGASEKIEVEYPTIWSDIKEVIHNTDAEKCLTKVSRERRSIGRLNYSPIDLNKSIGTQFNHRGWKSFREQFYITKDLELQDRIQHLPLKEQKAAILAEGEQPILSSNQIDFAKDGAAVEVQFGKFPFVSYDIFAKHIPYQSMGHFGIGIEILPMKDLQKRMSSGVAYFEAERAKIHRMGKYAPQLPIMMVGISQ